jgi:hypothetical protein
MKCDEARDGSKSHFQFEIVIRMNEGFAENFFAELN